MGYAEFASNSYDRKRQWVAKCYPRRKNVTIWADTLASRLIIEGKKVVGVEVIGKRKKVVRARKEVLVCSGPIGSLKLLLLR